MDSWSVTFGRRGATLVLRRERTADGFALIAVESGRPRTFSFTHLRQLVRFQRDMEAFLQRTGWSPVGMPAAEPQDVTAAVATDDETGLRLTLAEEEVAARR